MRDKRWEATSPSHHRPGVLCCQVLLADGGLRDTPLPSLTHFPLACSGLFSKRDGFYQSFVSNVLFSVLVGVGTLFFTVMVFVCLCVC